MKKSMFISTVMMVVLLIVALSTATFAWFSANDTVIANQTTMTAATSTDANIQISWDGIDYGQSISFKTADGLEPIMPMMRPVLADYDYNAQYITTAENYASGVDFSYASESVPYVNVVNFNTANTVVIGNATDTTYPGLTGTPEELGRIYRTQFAREQFYLMTQSTVAPGLYTAFPEGNFLTIVDGTEAINNEITIADANTTYPNLYLSGADCDEGTATQASASYIGYRIYDINELLDIHVAVGLGASAPTGWIAGGTGTSDPVAVDGVDYHVVVTTSGEIDTVVGTEYYINLEDVNTEFGIGPARDGDKIYCVRAAATEPKTDYDTFVGNFNTGTVDQLNRFRDSIGARAPITLSELDGDSNLFYIRNANALGSPAARINVTAEFTGDAVSADLRLAVFVKNTTDLDPYYVGTLAPGLTATNYGTLAFGAVSTANNFDSYNANGPTMNNFVQIDPAASITMQVVAWYDGIGLNTTKSGQAADFTLKFQAA